MSSKGKLSGGTPDEAALVPKLRFPEFVGRPLQDAQLADATAESTERNGSGQRPSQIMGVSKVEGIVPMEERIVAADTARYKFVRKDWFAYNPMRLNIGSIARWQGDNDILVSPDYVVFKCKSAGPHRLDPAYLDHYRRSVAWEEFVSEKGDGSVRVRIYYKDLGRLQMTLPSYPEQQKIADCLDSADALIAAQGRKVEALRAHKNGLMQQLFPQEGETQPRLRFPDFRDATPWEACTLESQCTAKISYGIVQAGPNVPDGMPYIKSTDLNSELCVGKLSRTSHEIAKKYRRSEVLPGDLVFSLRGNIGVSQIVPKEIPVANLTQGTARIRTRGPSAFYLAALQSQPVIVRILAVSKGSTFQEISLEALREITLFCPGIDEQQRIADCLTSLAALIAAETQKLDTLKVHKKGLMQQLFPSIAKVDA